MIDGSGGVRPFRKRASARPPYALAQQSPGACIATAPAMLPRHRQPHSESRSTVILKSGPTPAITGRQTRSCHSSLIDRPKSFDIQSANSVPSACGRRRWRPPRGDRPRRDKCFARSKNRQREQSYAKPCTARRSRHATCADRTPPFAKLAGAQQQRGRATIPSQPRPYPGKWGSGFRMRSFAMQKHRTRQVALVAARMVSPRPAATTARALCFFAYASSRISSHTPMASRLPTLPGGPCSDRRRLTLALDRSVRVLKVEAFARTRDAPGAPTALYGSKQGRPLLRPTLPRGRPHLTAGKIVCRLAPFSVRR